MKIVIAPDSFKGSLSATEAAKAMEKGVLEVFPKANVTLKPMADGGEGTLESILSAINGEKKHVPCTGPLGEMITATLGIVRKNTAIIECANVSGLTMVPPHLRNPENTTSYGLGEVIKYALDRNCEHILIGLGGSATNDGGLGMLLALGMEAFDENGQSVGFFGKDVRNVHRVSFNRLDRRLRTVTIQVASDVDNPLCGKRGASAVFAPQKGATPEMVKEFDYALDQFSSIVLKELNLHDDLKVARGAGAAGGLGFALLMLGAKIGSGAELVAKTINLEESMREATLVLTGEGQTDEQTLYGKAPGYVASLGKKHHVPTLLISGSLSGKIDSLLNQFDGCFSLVNKPMSLEECLEQASDLLYMKTKQIMHFYRSIKKTLN